MPVRKETKDNLELQKVKEMMPYFRSLMGENVNLSVADLKKIIYYERGRGSNIDVGIKEGYILDEGTLPASAIKTGRRQSGIVSQKVFGVPLVGTSMPVKLGDRVIGAFTISRFIVPEDSLNDLEQEFSIIKQSIFSVFNKKELLNESEKLNLGESLFINQNETPHLSEIVDLSEHSRKVLLKNYGYRFEDLVFCSKKMADLIKAARRISLTENTVLILGESGTGKELLAQSIHNYSNRQNNRFLPINCAAMPKDLIQSELFGHEEGSFTGSKKGGRVGIFELANGGTVFLDEIGDMEISAQANLLRVIEEKRIRRIGGNKDIPINVRVIAASNRDLQNEVKEGRFREDLFYRLNVVALKIPPLRQRREDIGVLLRYFIGKHGKALKSPATVKIDLKVEKILHDYDWPGNVRQLENTFIAILNLLDNNRIEVNNLPVELRAFKLNMQTNIPTLDEVERKMIIEALLNSSSNIAKAAKILGISRSTLYFKLKRHKIQ